MYFSSSFCSLDTRSARAYAREGGPDPQMATRPTETRPQPVVSSAKAPCACGGPCPRCQSSSTSVLREALSSTSRPLPSPLRQESAASLGDDLADVRVHEGSAASAAAERFGANAFAHGRDIVLGANAPSAHSSAGRSLLRHEAAHTAQSRPSATRTDIEPSILSRDSPSEHAARGADPFASAARHVLPAGAIARDEKTSKTKLRVTGVQVHGSPPVVYVSLSNGIIYPMQGSGHINPGKYQIYARLTKTEVVKGNTRVKRFMAEVSPTSETKNTMGQGISFSGKFGLDLGDVEADTAWHGVYLHSQMPEKAAELEDTAITFKEDTLLANKKTSAEADASSEPPPTTTQTGPTHSLGDPDAAPGPRNGLFGTRSTGKVDMESAESSDEVSYDTYNEDAQVPDGLVHAYPSRIEGPDAQPTLGKAPYTMHLNYQQSSLVGAVFEAHNPVDYTWELYGASFGKKDITRGEAIGRGYDQSLGHVKKMSDNAATDRNQALAEGRIGDAAANQAIRELEGASTLVKLTSETINAFAELTSNIEYTRDVPFPLDEGVYRVRVIAQPRDRPQPDGRVIKFAPSIASKDIIVKDPNRLAVDAQREQETRLEELKFAFDLETDPRRKQELSDAILDLKTILTGSAVDVIQRSIERTKRELEKNKNNPIAVAKIQEQLTSLEKQLALAQDRSKEITDAGGHQYSPLVHFASEFDGRNYPLLLQLGVVDPPSEGGEYRASISDVTSKSGKKTYLGVNADASTAVWAAFTSFAADNEYGPGRVAVTLPSNSSFSPRSRVLTNFNRGTAALRERFEDTVAVVGTVAIFVPGLGEIAMVLGAASAAEHLATKYDNGTLDWSDPATIGDLLNLVAAAAGGVARVGKFDVVRQGNSFAMKAMRGVSMGATYLEAGANYGQMAIGNLQVFTALQKINQAYASGSIDAITARRMQAQTLGAALQQGAMLFGPLASREKVSEKFKVPDEVAALPPVKEDPTHRTPSTPDSHTAAPKSHADGDTNPQGPKSKTPIESDTTATRRTDASHPAPDGVTKNPLHEKTATNGPDAQSPSARAPTAKKTSAPEPQTPSTKARTEAAPDVKIAEAPAKTPAWQPPAEQIMELDLPDGTVISNLDRAGATTAYKNSVAERPHLESGLYLDVASGEYVVVQGNATTVSSSKILYADPEFSSRLWKLVAHFHPGGDLFARMPSEADFQVITHWQRFGLENPQAIHSDIHYVSGPDGTHGTTRFGYDPNSSRPYYVEYTDTTGKSTRHDFVDAPWEAGSDYSRFLKTFTGTASDIVPPPKKPPTNPAGSTTPANPASADNPLKAPLVPEPNAPSLVPPGKTPQEAATDYANRWGGRLPLNDGLVGIFTRTQGDGSLPVDQRAAAAELGRIHHLLVNGLNGQSITRIDVISPTSTQRTPDLVLHFADGSHTRFEIRSITSAPRGTFTGNSADRAAATQQRAQPRSAGDLAAAIWSKGRSSSSRRSQLDVPLTGVDPSGTISIVVTGADVTTAIADDAVNSVASRLGTHVRQITISFLGDRDASGALRRTTLVYDRTGSVFIRLP